MILAILLVIPTLLATGVAYWSTGLFTSLSKPGAPGFALETWELAHDRRFLLQDSGFALQSTMWRSRSTRRRASVIFMSATSASSKPLSSISLRLLTSTNFATESIAWLR